MRQGKVFQISKEDYKKALEQGAKALIGAHEGEIITADDTELIDIATDW